MTCSVEVCGVGSMRAEGLFEDRQEQSTCRNEREEDKEREWNVGEEKGSNLSNTPNGVGNIMTSSLSSSTFSTSTSASSCFSFIFR